MDCPYLGLSHGGLTLENVFEILGKLCPMSGCPTYLLGRFDFEAPSKKPYLQALRERECKNPFYQDAQGTLFSL